MSSALLTVEDLSLGLSTSKGIVNLVRDVNLEVYPGEVVGVVGESGSGKTVTCLSFTRLLDSPPLVYQKGRVLFGGKNIWDLPENGLQKIRATGIGIIFQEAGSALNPVVKIGRQISEVLEKHFQLSRREAKAKSIELLRQVGIPSPEERFDQYPHQLSGGMQQRVMIAIALAGAPRLLIADEPTTALDVTIQVQILEELRRLNKERQMAMLFINHDLGLIAELCDRVMVMYAGEIVETTDVKTLFRSPRHPYTRLLLESIPRIDLERGQLKEIPGQVPAPGEFPEGCRFHPRCPYALEDCRQQRPPLTQANNSQFRCWNPL
ncbi:MAG: ABC transporter ATP-binding protein [Calditrichia bacterium]